MHNRGPSSQSYGFSNSLVWMWDSDHKDSSVLKNWCFWTVVLEKTPENLLDCKEIKPVNPKGNNPWVFIKRTDADAEAPILWPPNAKSWLIGKDLDSGKDWGQKKKGAAEDGMVISLVNYFQSPSNKALTTTLLLCFCLGNYSNAWLV